MPRRPTEQLQAGRAFYANRLPGIDVEHFGALWHLFTLGHLVETDLESIARPMGCSFADLDCLGTLAVDEQRRLRATDLASALYVSDAVMSERIARLHRQGLIARTPHPDDRRAYTLALTDAGRQLLDRAVEVVAAQAKLVRFLRQLPTEDRQQLVRILGDLHQMYDREFAGQPYFDG
ncbi:MAG TPA: MarR family transcriptional regulator [Novosphingobium sp.]|nr:MarR family transcriptional regulator [Novosphingobium sp.]HZV11455.1 MarR family transcriptional regulator [Novosphingobium sp.]